MITLKIDKTKICIVLIVVYLLFPQLNSFNSTEANMYIPGISMGIGGILYPNTSNTLHMVEADVNFLVNANLKKRILVDFEGVYHVRNLNETLTTTVAAPFVKYFDDINLSIEVYADNEKIGTSIIYLNGTDLEHLKDYIYDYYSGRYFVLANVTLKGHSTTIIRYTWESKIVPQEHDYYVAIQYDVGTGRAWNNTITERVTMTVVGRKPDYYRNYLSYDYIDDEFVVSNKVNKLNSLGFHSYIWEWYNDSIQVDNVGISYDYIPPHYPVDIQFYFPQMMAGIATLAVLVIGTFILINRARRKEGL
jgi:hypothetical protein